MKNGRYQAKDIPDELVFLVFELVRDANGHATVFGFLEMVYPWKVVMAKLRSMEKRDIVEDVGAGHELMYIRLLIDSPFRSAVEYQMSFIDSDPSTLVANLIDKLGVI